MTESAVQDSTKEHTCSRMTSCVTTVQDNSAMLTSSVSTLTMIFISVFSSRPERVFFMGLNLLTNMSMSPVSRACACCSVSPHVARGGRTKTADAICTQQWCMNLHTEQLLSIMYMLRMTRRQLQGPPKPPASFPPALPSCIH